ncbi:MAG: type II secretion system protein [Planctomycetota bacterium]
MPHRPTSDRRAFSLVETLVALVILSIAAPPMLFAIAAAHDERAGPAMLAQARWLAIERLEESIRDANSATRGYDHVVNASYPDEPAVAGFPGFARTVRVNETAPDLASSGSGAKTITVTVSWSMRGGTPVSVSASAVVAEMIP